jgi:hypothetical protein
MRKNGYIFIVFDEFFNRSKERSIGPPPMDDIRQCFKVQYHFADDIEKLQLQVNIALTFLNNLLFFLSKTSNSFTSDSTLSIKAD